MTTDVIVFPMRPLVAHDSCKEDSCNRYTDKGDGTPSSKAEASRRHAHLNDGHIPDMYRLGPPHVLYEWKCYTPFRSKGALGNGSRRCGGAASTTDGNSFAFGNTRLSGCSPSFLAKRHEAHPLTRRSTAARA